MRAAAPRRQRPITGIEMGAPPTASVPVSVPTAASPHHQSMAITARKGATAATHHLDGASWWSELTGKQPWPSCAVSASQLRCNGLSGLSARSPAWARARLSRKATSAPSGADSMIVLIASFTSAKSPVWTANISRARRSYTSEGRSAPLTNTPSQVHVHRRGGRNHVRRESGLPGLRGRGQGAQPRQVPGPPQRGRDGRRAPWPLVNGRTKGLQRFLSAICAFHKALG